MKRSWTVSTPPGANRWLSGCGALALTLPALLMAAQAHAQADQPQAADGEAESTDIVVTGSRLGSGFEAPTPVTTIGAAQIQDRALTSIAELNYEIPQLRVNQNIGRSSEPIGQNQIDLRALGSARTLILLDGRRMAATSPFGGIDSNLFPLALISNVEVVTGGASAAYGSDAVAGVVNFGLQKDFTGLKLDASYGFSKYGDYNRPVVSGAAGTSLLDNRLHLTVAGDFYRNTGQTSQGSRPWGQGRPILFANPTYTPTNGETKNYIAYDGRLVATFGGLITGVNADTSAANGVDVLRGIQFGPGGTVLPFTYGSPANTTYMLGGDGDSIEDDGNLLPHITRYSGYGRASFDMSDRLTVWTDVLYSRLEVLSDLSGNYDLAGSALTIQRDNAFLPTTIRDIMVANNIQSFKLSRVNREDGYAQNNNRVRALRYAVGLNGNFGDWEWDFTAQRSDNRFEQESLNNRLQQNWRDGTDAVISPITSQPVCRINADATSANDNPACVAINVFGAGSLSPAAQAWYRGTSSYHSRITQNLVDLNVRGKPFSTWAGAVNVAVGGQYRRETIDNVSDPDSDARRWRSINQQSFSGELSVKEVYLETAIPLARGMAFADNLELNGAVRYADYSSSGGVTTWKVGLNYNPIPDIRLRGTISRDIRAANINELFSGQNQVLNQLADPRPNPPLPAAQHPPSYTVLQLTGGNTNLTPEKADTKAFGVVLQPSFLPGLSASVDYYTIKIENAITTVPSQTIVNNCFNSNLSEFCDLITVDPVSNLMTQVVATVVNAQTIETSGIDFEVAYRHPLAMFGQDGTLSTRLLVNYVDELALTVSGKTTSYVGDLATDYSGQPRWKWNYDLTWSGGPLRIGAYIRYIGGGQFRSTYVSGVDLPADQNEVKGAAYVNLSASYKLTDNIEVYGKVDNLFDKAPPILPNNITQPTVANSQMFDKIGRYYVIGARLRF